MGQNYGHGHGSLFIPEDRVRVQLQPERGRRCSLLEALGAKSPQNSIYQLENYQTG